MKEKDKTVEFLKDIFNLKDEESIKKPKGNSFYEKYRLYFEKQKEKQESEKKND